MESARAAKAAGKKAAAEAQQDAIDGLAQMEIAQEQEKATQHNRVVRHMHTFLDVTAQNSCEEFDSSPLENVEEATEEGDGDWDDDSDQESDSEQDEDTESESEEAKSTKKKVSRSRILPEMIKTYCYRRTKESGSYSLRCPERRLLRNVMPKKGVLIQSSIDGNFDDTC
jgi:hypothetical protein